MDIIKKSSSEPSLGPRGPVSTIDMESKYNENIMQIFNYGNSSVNIIGSVDNIHLCAKDVLLALGHDADSRGINAFLHKCVPPEFKKTLKDIIDLCPGLKISTSSCKNLRSIYLTEFGFYYLVMRSNKTKARDFQDYVYQLLKTLRLNRVKRLQNELERSKCRNDELEVHALRLEEKMNQNNIAAEERYNKLMRQMEMLSEQTKVAYAKLDETNAKLDEANDNLEYLREDNKDLKDMVDETTDQLEDTIDKLDDLKLDNKELKNTVEDIREDLSTVIEDRNVDPKRVSKIHYYLLLKKIDSDPIEFKLVSGQSSYVEKQTKILTGYEITALEKNPNPIDLRVKIKEYIDALNTKKRTAAMNMLKSSILYKVSRDKAYLRNQCKEQNTLVYHNLNNYILKNFDEEGFINLIGEIIKEKYVITKLPR